MRELMPTIIAVIVAAVAAIGYAYYERGFFAVGFEWLVPIAVCAVMNYWADLDDLKEEEYEQ